MAAKKKSTKKAAKRARGRPPLPASERSSRRVTVRLLPHDVDTLADKAERAGLSEGELIRAAIHAYDVP